jgi:hypothetical protein
MKIVRPRQLAPNAEPPSANVTVAAAAPAPSAGRFARLRIPLPISVGLGLLGYCGMVVTGTRLGPLADPPLHHPELGRWWFQLPAGHLDLLRVLFYVASVVAIAGWLGVGEAAWHGRLSLRAGIAVLVAWSAPLLIGPPIFSKDVYSYIGQGLIAHRGLNPYVVSPSVLGHGPLLNSIASVWTHSPAPYGPLFVEIARAVTAVVGTSIVPEVVVMRGLEVAGMVLLAVFLPRLAKRVGVDPVLALWLGVLSPLVLLGFMASGHNDCLMIGLVVAGVSLSLDGRRSLGLVLCALAAMIKAPAGAAVVILAIDELRMSGGGRRALRVLAKVVAVPVATVVAVTLASGLGWRWLQPSNLRIPAELRIEATPTVSIAYAISRVLSVLGIDLHPVGAVQSIAGVVAGLVVLWLLWRFRRENLVRVLGAVLLIVVLAGPTLWPWYLSWGLIVLAATSSQRSKVLVVAAGAAMLLAGPVGTPMLNGYWFWGVSVLTVAGCAWLLSQRRWTSVLLGPSSGQERR